MLVCQYTGVLSRLLLADPRMVCLALLCGAGVGRAASVGRAAQTCLAAGDALEAAMALLGQVEVKSL